MTALERAARAIYEARNGHGCKVWAHQPKEYREPYMADARAVLQAIRTPDGAVVHAGGDKLFRDYSAFAADNEARDAFTAMIDHILEGE